MGGTKIEAALVAKDGTLLAHSITQTPKDSSQEEVYTAVKELIVDKIKQRAPSAIGIGCAGPMDKESGLVSPINIKEWVDFPLKKRIAEDFGLPVFLENDVKALALGEGYLGNAKNYKNYIAVVVSTGIGGGIVLNGNLLEGRLGNAGHVGHVIVEPKGRKCGCGALGCVEAEASGVAIEKITGKKPEFASEEVRVRTGTLVGRALSSVANLLDLNLAVVGGSVALGFGDTFFNAANLEVSKRCKLEFSKDFVIRPISVRKTNLIGAGIVAFKELGEF